MKIIPDDLYWRSETKDLPEGVCKEEHSGFTMNWTFRSDDERHLPGRKKDPKLHPKFVEGCAEDLRSLQSIIERVPQERGEEIGEIQVVVRYKKPVPDFTEDDEIEQ